MALRENLHERFQPFLEPGEQVHQVFLARSGPSPFFSLITSRVVLVAGHYAVVAVTDRAIVVLRAARPCADMSGR